MRIGETLGRVSIFIMIRRRKSRSLHKLDISTYLNHARAHTRTYSFTCLSIGTVVCGPAEDGIGQLKGKRSKLPSLSGQRKVHTYGSGQMRLQ